MQLYIRRIRRFLRDSLQDVGAFDYPNGVPQSEVQGTGEQWDFPNGWSPSNHMLIEGLRKSESPEMQDQVAICSFRSTFER